MKKLLCALVILCGTVSLNAHQVSFEVSLDCPLSQELVNLSNAIDAIDDNASSFDEFSRDTIALLEGILKLVKSGNIEDGSYSISVNY